ncbi:MAG: UDP-3-O-acyl-N-acetylglucosamine deacetylase [Proteobacteria bacterium]|nr:UDP-3-O-acyl-N-acetylglucosamine deacetylase [Pseudomonadota bacterium]
MKNFAILLVDDEASIVNSLRGSLEDEGHIVLTASDGNRALEIVKSHPVDIVFLDIWLPGMDGIQTLKAVKDFDSAIDVVMRTGHGTVNTAVQAVKHGAFDFLEKPFSLDAVIGIIRKIREKQQMTGKGSAGAKAADSRDDLPALSGDSHAIVTVMDQIKSASSGKGHVLLLGETGTGKEHAAELIHVGSGYKKKTFEKINCAFFTPDELADKLFGDNQSGKNGLLTGEGSGVLFLQALDAVPPEMQKRLADQLGQLQHKEEGCLRIVGATVKTAHDGVLKKVLAESFQHTILLPPLRERRSDIPVMLNAFLGQFCREYGFREKQFDDGSLELLVNYDWPGNVKELKNLTEKIVVSVPTKIISAQDLPSTLREEVQHTPSRSYEQCLSMAEAEVTWRKNYLLHHLRKNDRNVAKTAAAIHIREKDLKKLIKEYGIVLAKENPSGKRFQRTLKRAMVVSGQGLHSGDKTGLILTPLPPGSGIVFGNISSDDTIPASIDYVVSTDYSTCLQNTNSTARTIEHCLATLHAYRITNLMIKINNEVPIMDGSAVDFCKMIEDAGIEEQEAPAEDIVLTEKFVIGEIDGGKKHMIVEPAERFSIHYMLQYPKPVGRQEYTFVMDDEESFKNEIAPARTFGFLRDIEALQERGLASGGKLNNFILIDNEKVVNTELRFPDEFVRHKILDMIGDLYLLGRPIRARITANMTGHTDNAPMVRMIRDRMHL